MSKTEGTSQTYGQLILLPSKEIGTSVIKTTESDAVTSKDILVKLNSRA